jgi:hypothetical protein
MILQAVAVEIDCLGHTGIRIPYTLSFYKILVNLNFLYFSNKYKRVIKYFYNKKYKYNSWSISIFIRALMSSEIYFLSL